MSWQGIHVLMEKWENVTSDYFNCYLMQLSY